MERKVWLLILLVTLISIRSFSQGFEFVACEQTLEIDTSSSQYCIYNFNSDSTLEIPPYSFVSRKVFRENLLDKWYINKRNNGHKYIEKHLKNKNTGRNIHFYNNGSYTVILCPESNSLISINNKSNSVSETTISGVPFGVAISEKRNEVYISGLFSRSILAFDINTLNIIDSIPVNGQSPRFISIDGKEDALFCGVRSSNSLVKINIESRKLVSFVGTENIPGPIFQSDSTVYLLQTQNNILGKFKKDNLEHLESRRLNDYPLKFSYNKAINSMTFYSSSCIKLKDTLANRVIDYKNLALDSTGRYTWVINSYTNPKWALVQMETFKEKGINCYLSNLTDGYFRLCAGLYQNQELAVTERAKYEELFDGSWLMTIHPHKF